MAISCFQTVLFIIAVLIIPQAVDALNCYTCASEDSSDDCNSKMKDTSCPSGTPDCVVGVLLCTAGEVTKTVYYKGCGVTGDDCDIRSQNMPNCPSSQSSWSYSSTKNCCSRDKCNGGSTGRGSGPLRCGSVMLGVCLLFAVWVVVFMY